MPSVSNETFTLRNCLASLFMGAAIALVGCGSDDAEELTTETAQAALVSREVTDTLSPLVQFHGETAGRLPLNFDKVALGDEEISSLIAGLQTLIDGATASRCGKVDKLDQRSYRLTFTDCSYGKDTTFTLDGALSLVWDFDKTSKTATISTTFASFKINTRQIDGEMTTTFLTGATRGALTVDLNLVFTDPAGQQKTLSLKGTINNDIAGKSVTFSGSGVISLSGITYTITIAAMKIRYGDQAPHAGSVTLVSGPLTVQVIFSEQTVTDGLFTIVVNGREMGQWSLEELRSFLAGA